MAPGKGSGWILGWTPPNLSTGSLPHDQYFISVPSQFDPDDISQRLRSSLLRIARAQGVGIKQPVWVEPMHDPERVIGYMTGAEKSTRKICLPPAPRPGKRIRSYDLRNLLSTPVADLMATIREDEMRRRSRSPRRKAKRLGRTGALRDKSTPLRDKKRSRAAVGDERSALVDDARE